MPVAPTYPGVYVEELPSGVKTITGVSTAVTAFLGYFFQGPMNTPVQCFSVADLESNFGPLNSLSEASYSVRQFFANGGAEAWVVRVASSTSQPTPASVNIEDSTNTPILLVSADSPGSWGNSVRVNIDYNTTSPASLFNLTITEVDGSNPPNILATEMYRNLSMTAGAANYAVEAVNASSSLVTLAPVGTPTTLPVPSGTVSNDISGLAGSLSGLAGQSMDVQFNGSTLGTVTLATAPTNLTTLANMVQAQLRALGTPPAVPNATVNLVPGPTSGTLLQIWAVSSTPGALFSFSGSLADSLTIETGGSATPSVNVQQYALGASTPAGFQGTGVQGGDGAPPDGLGLNGDPAAKTGIYALDNAPGFNILCLPDLMYLDDNSASAVISAAAAYCQSNWAFLIVDVPQNSNGLSAANPAQRDNLVAIQEWMAQYGAIANSSYAALYFPRPQIPDPVNNYRLRSVPPSGTLAGIYAQTDSARGVWKAPAGTATVLGNVPSLTLALTDPENGVLNPLAINCLRSFPVYGNVCWGARTMAGPDKLESQWKYIPVRRLALYIEASLYGGTQWVVFEPNAEPLWSQIRLNVGTFMQQLFQQGAFAGTTPISAYFVQCDSTTTTQADINNGVVNIIVGFAPLLPAEFVVLQIQQIAGQTPS